MQIDLPVTNLNRTVGTMLSYHISKIHGRDGLPDDTIRIKLRGAPFCLFVKWLWLCLWCLSVCLSVCLRLVGVVVVVSVRLSVCLSVGLLVCRSVFCLRSFFVVVMVTVRLSICLSIRRRSTDGA